jgi:hypothetical protein
MEDSQLDDEEYQKLRARRELDDAWGNYRSGTDADVAECSRRCWLYSLFFDYERTQMDGDLRSLITLMKRTYSPILAPRQTERSESGTAGRAYTGRYHAEMINETFDMVLASDDVVIKRFLILVLLASDEGAQRQVSALCDEPVVRPFLEFLREECNALTYKPFNVHNVEYIVREFEASLVRNYATGGQSHRADEISTKQNYWMTLLHRQHTQG